MYGGVYSFLPLGEAKSGAKFPIQADFLVQPGREAINYESKWNHWLVEEVCTLCKEAIDFFKKHKRWKYQFLPAFEFTKFPGLESYEQLFGPKLVEPIEKFIKENDCVSTVDGGWAKLGQVVKLKEDEGASEELVTMGVLKKNEIAPVIGGQSGMKLAHPNARDCKSFPIKEIDRLDLLRNNAFLEDNAGKPNAASWFRSLYLWLSKHPIYKDIFYYKWRKELIRYHDFEFILTSERKLLRGGSVYLPDLPSSDPVLKNLADTLQKPRAVLHPDILAGAKDEDEEKQLRGFLTGLAGVQVLDSRTVCEEVLLPKILTNAPKPRPDDLLKYTRHCQQILGDRIGRDLEFWVLTKDENVKAAKEVFFPKEFKPEQDWETNNQYVSGLSFINPKYIMDNSNDDELKAWREFFKIGGVKDAPEKGVEEFAMNYTMEKLKAFSKTVVPVEKRNFGYDIEVEDQTGEKMRIEVKGQSYDQDVELKDNEAEAADTHKDFFYLCVVSSIPENPTMYMLKNPAAPGIGKKDKLTIPIDIWKAAKWP